MPEDKSPGPDGFTTGFYKKACSIVGEDVLRAVESFFKYGTMLKGFNAIPSLWFLKSMLLEAFQFPGIFTSWIKACICNSWFSISINGSLEGFFKGAKGIRQGDPLSPYLFVLVMEVLSQLLNKAALDGKLGYHPKCKTSKLTHLCFADDLFIFCDGTIESNNAIHEVFKQFYTISGLHLNNKKTEIYCGGVEFQSFSVGDGSSIFFWYNSWNNLDPMNSMKEAFPSIPDHAKVDMVLQQGTWHWPMNTNAGSETIKKVASELVFETQDTVQWQGRANHSFKLCEIYKALRDKSPLFRSRLAAWGVVNDASCCFCDIALETTDHLFVGCHYSCNVWDTFLSFIGSSHAPTSWEGEMR